MSRSLAILGAGGHGRVVADCAEAVGWERIIFFDNKPDAALEGPWAVVGSGDNLIAQARAFDGVVVAVGSNGLRLSLLLALERAGARLATLIHPRATLSSRSVIGTGSVVIAGAVINIGARVGKGVIVNTGATIDHDCVLEDGVHVAPGAHLAGGVTVGKESWIGVGAAVREYTSIGEGVFVGAGAVVVDPIQSGLKVVGNPARQICR
jgi:sugar O-acyltransferase (sialic acid O-acetyltransferase NeuD family)